MYIIYNKNATQTTSTAIHVTFFFIPNTISKYTR